MPALLPIFAILAVFVFISTHAAISPPPRRRRSSSSRGYGDYDDDFERSRRDRHSSEKGRSKQYDRSRY